MQHKKIGVIGGGTMGAGIAQVAAQAGHTVVVVDRSGEVLEKAQKQLAVLMQKKVDKQQMRVDEATQLQARITWTSDLMLLSGASLVIEAIVENLGIKQSLFSELEGIVDASCILASNTSSLSITSIASACKNPERVMGIHFFNPAPLMALVEMVPALQSDMHLVEQTTALIQSWGKSTVLAKDIPGFIVNRLARPYYSEALRIYEEGIADISSIDEAMRRIGGFKMGPFELMDLIGHDVNYTVTETVWQSYYYDVRYTPSYVQKRLVEAGWLGRKRGRGFYTYVDGQIQRGAVTANEATLQAIAERIILMLIHEAAHGLYLGVASKEDIDKAMQLGVNYPQGLLQWADAWGHDVCVQRMDALYARYREDRYRGAVLLRDTLNQTFF
ncbi:MAG: 3-hydroxyacyl-CoA dehydrogenase NAD-binding domain-containing protein [Chitinophagaceae bacterium]